MGKTAEPIALAQPREAERNIVEHLHSEFVAGSEATAVVTLDHQANVLLMDSGNYSAYQRGRPYRYIGGWATSSPVRLCPPHHAHWHVVVDLGGRRGQVQAGIQVIGA